MKKFCLLSSLLLVMFFLLVSAKSVSAQLCVDPGATGIVPCGTKEQEMYSYELHKDNIIVIKPEVRVNYRIEVLLLPLAPETELASAYAEAKKSRPDHTDFHCKYWDHHTFTLTSFYDCNSLEPAKTRVEKETLKGIITGNDKQDAMNKFNAIAREPLQRGFYVASFEFKERISVCPCQLGHFFLMLLRIYDFIVWNIAILLAGLFIVIGGVLWLVSGGNQKLIDLGKNILKYSVLGLLLVFSSWLIIDVVLKAIGYTLPWSRF